MDNTLKKVKEKVHSDYKQLVIPFHELTKSKIIENAYELAHYNEIWWFFDSLEDDYGFLEDEEELLEKIISFKGNIVSVIWNFWLNCNHPERFNFFVYEDLVEIIRSAIK